MIIFRNFNLSRLLSSQVAPVRLGVELRRSNAFLHFFFSARNWWPGLFRVAGRAGACGHYFFFAEHKLPIPKQSYCCPISQRICSTRGIPSPWHVEWSVILV